jgi:hypothetical protein
MKAIILRDILEKNGFNVYIVIDNGYALLFVDDVCQMKVLL